VNIKKESIKRVEELAVEGGLAADALSVAHLIMAAIEPLADKGTSIDSGCGLCSSDLWIKIGGIEWYLNIRKSNNQIAQESVA
jgi:hypothetical protein